MGRPGCAKGRIDCCSEEERVTLSRHISILFLATVARKVGCCRHGHGADIIDLGKLATMGWEGARNGEVVGVGAKLATVNE
jgi:hypothetical protein